MAAYYFSQLDPAIFDFRAFRFYAQKHDGSRSLFNNCKGRLQGLREGTFRGIVMVARKNDYHRIWIRVRNAHEGRENCRSRASIGRLHYCLRRPICKAWKIVLLVRARDRVQDLIWGHASFRAISGLLKEASLTEKR